MIAMMNLMSFECLICFGFKYLSWGYQDLLNFPISNVIAVEMVMKSMLPGLSKMLPCPCRILQKCTTFGGPDTPPAIFSESEQNRMKLYLNWNVDRGCG